MIEKFKRKTKQKKFTQHHFWHARNDAGFAVLFAALVGSVALTVGLSIFNITLRELVLSSQVRESHAAFSAADAGIECALYWDQKPPAAGQGSVFGSFNTPVVGTLDDGLIGYWPLDDEESPTEDVAGTHDGTLVNGPLWDDGEEGKALVFDGVKVQSVSIPVISALQGENTWTVSLWALSSANRQSKGSFSIYDSLVGTAQLFIIYPFDNWNCAADSCAGVRVWYNGTSVINENNANRIDGKFHHFVFVQRSATNMEMYVDGMSAGISALSKSIPNSITQIQIGAWNTQAFTGFIDDVRIYDRALSEQEVEELHNLFVPQPKLPLGINSGLNCVGADITLFATGWEKKAVAGTGWDQQLQDTNYKTWFDLEFEDGRCATVLVEKDATNGTKIESRGYNTCDPDNPRRVERGLRATYQ